MCDVCVREHVYTRGISFSVFILESELSGVCCMHVGDQCVSVFCACVFLAAYLYIAMCAL